MTEVVPYINRSWVDLRLPATELAEAIADSAFVPKGLRGNPPAVLACILFGDELGIGPMQSLARIAMIDGTPTLRAETMRALVLAAGHEIWIDEATTTRVTVSGRRAGSSRSSSVTWTVDDAKTAGLAGKPSYRAYPRQMLTARATAELVRTVFADVVGGLSALEELEIDDYVAAHAREPELPAKTSRRKRADKQAVTAETGPDTGPAGPAGPDEVVEPQSIRADLVADVPDGQMTVDDVVAETTLDETLADPAAKADLVEPYAQELLDAVDAARVEALPDEMVDEDERLEAEAKADAAEAVMMSDGQRRKMQALFREVDVQRREARLEYCNTIAGRKLGSSKELTFEEAGQVIESLAAWKANPAGGPFQDGMPI